MYEKQDYVLAYLENQKILKINPSDQEAKNYKEAIENFLNTENLQKYFQPLIEEDKLNSAKSTIETLLTSNIINQNLLIRWKKKIEQAENLKKQKIDFEKAEYLFKEEMYQQALPIYQKLKEENLEMASLEQRIEICKDTDPKLIIKKIQKAFDAAVASKKNYHDTFKTYYKYENSGYLKGTNFHFMCLMMIDRANKRLLQDMGISPNQAKNLAIKYFYKARNLGFNNKDIEVIVFTKNFNKNKN